MKTACCCDVTLYVRCVCCGSFVSQSRGDDADDDHVDGESGDGVKYASGTKRCEVRCERFNASSYVGGGCDVGDDIGGDIVN